MNNFWETKQLSEMTQQEWESLCDGCGKCCTISLEDIDTGDLISTSIACQYFDSQDCRCQSYQQRSKLVPDCLTLTPEMLAEINWLPHNCGYRLLREGLPLPQWHPLISGKADSTIASGNSVQGKVISEYDVHPDDLDNFIIEENW